MDFGKLPEHIYQRSVEKVIHTTEYRKITINGAGLGADCAILPDENGYLVTAQGSADGTDVKVAMRAFYAGLNNWQPQEFSRSSHQSVPVLMLLLHIPLQTRSVTSQRCI